MKVVCVSGAFLPFSLLSFPDSDGQIPDSSSLAASRSQHASKQAGPRFFLPSSTAPLGGVACVAVRVRVPLEAASQPGVGLSGGGSASDGSGARQISALHLTKSNLQ